jgi:RNA recognition motif-containing protein
MEATIYVGNLPRSTTEEELQALFRQAGEVTSVNLYKDRKSGESNGFAFITMSAQSEANKAVSMFHTHFLGDHNLKVNLVQSRAKSYTTGRIVEP